MFVNNSRLVAFCTAAEKIVCASAGIILFSMASEELLIPEMNPHHLMSHNRLYDLTIILGASGGVLGFMAASLLSRPKIV
jgi:hypothetical protein